MPSGKIVYDALFGADGIADYLQRGSLVIDASTTSRNNALEAEAALAPKGISFLDAPVSGMQTRAEEGDLTMMVGGDLVLFEKHRETLSSMASKLLHVGAVGAGQLSKLVNQLLYDINMAALAEIMPIAAKLGLKPEQISEIVNSGTGRSWASQFFLPNILNNVFDKSYPLQAAYKDIIAGPEITSENHFPAPVLAAASTTYQQALAEGYGASDKGAMIKVYERLLDVEFRAQ